MPNRDYEDSPYNRQEGRFESRDDQNWRDQSNRGSRDWDRRGEDFRHGREDVRMGRDGSREAYEPRRYEREAFEPRRYESEGYGFGDRDRGAGQRYAGYPQGGYPPSWQDERREGRFGQDWSRPQQDWGRPQQQGGYSGSGTYSAGGHGGQQGGYSRDWGHAQSYQGNVGPDYGRQDYGFRRDYGRQDYDFNRPDFSRAQSNYGARDQGEPFAERGRDESWTQQLRHTGQQMANRVKRAFRGPKGYKRSDERIREDVSDRLAQQDELDPSDIEVTVSNGEVTLSGTVANRREKFLAEEIADDVSGVTEVNVQLRIRREDQPTSTTATTSAASANLESGQRNRNARA